MRRPSPSAEGSTFQISFTGGARVPRQRRNRRMPVPSFGKPSEQSLVVRPSGRLFRRLDCPEDRICWSEQENHSRGARYPVRGWCRRESGAGLQMHLSGSADSFHQTVGQSSDCIHAVLHNSERIQKSVLDFLSRAHELGCLQIGFGAVARKTAASRIFLLDAVVSQTVNHEPQKGTHGPLHARP